MVIAPFPEDEELRIKDLYSYGILDSEKEKDFDDLAQLASEICDCPIGLITFIDTERQWIMAGNVITQTETSRDVAFCSHTILQDNVLVVKNASEDERFANNPLVTGDPRIQFYAGAPIVSSAGYKLGSVCVLDNISKLELTDNQKKALTIIAQQVSKLLELRIKNSMLIKHAEALVAAEKRITQLTVLQNDKQNNFIAYELHENIGQSLAGIKLFLESGDSAKDLSPYFFQKSKELISEIIIEMRNLSKSIIPSTFENADYFWLIQDYAILFCEKNDIHIKFGESVVIKNSQSNAGLNLFRIIQNQLVISKNCKANNISITLKCSQRITLIYKDDGSMADANTENKIQNDHIITRVDMCSGEIIRGFGSDGNELIIHLPL